MNLTVLDAPSTCCHPVVGRAVLRFLCRECVSDAVIVRLKGAWRSRRLHAAQACHVERRRDRWKERTMVRPEGRAPFLNPWKHDKRNSNRRTARRIVERTDPTGRGTHALPARRHCPARCSRENRAVTGAHGQTGFRLRRGAPSHHQRVAFLRPGGTGQVPRAHIGPAGSLLFPPAPFMGWQPGPRAARAKRTPRSRSANMP